MAGFDIFNNNAFSMVSLTNRINEVPFVPGQAGRLLPWNEQGVRTTIVAVENLKGTLTLIPNTPREAPPYQNKKDFRSLRSFTLPHLPLSDTINASEIQNVRSFGSETELIQVQDEVAQRMLRMSRSHDATVEYGRIGAIRGTILDADGTTVLYNLFTEYNVTQLSVDFVLGTPGTDVLAKCVEVREKIQEELGGEGGDDLRVNAFVGATFFSKLVSHATVREAYKYYQTTVLNMNPLQQDIRYLGFTFGGITFYVYRGSVNGIPFMPASEGNAFPIDVPDLFQTYYGPATWMETVNTLGRPRYAKQYPESNRNVAQVVETQSNPLSIMTRPRTSIKLTTSN